MEKQKDYIASLSEMINVPTVSNGTSFDEKNFLSFRNLLRKLFPNVFANFKYDEFEGAILLNHIASKDSEAILLMSHYDVVSADETWSSDPFKATLKNGKLYGRGTLDTKGNLWAILTSIEELLIEGYQFKKSIYIESNCNEETSGRGAYLVSRELKNRGVNFTYTLDEGGMIVYDPIGGADGTFAMIALGEKDYLDLKFIAKSKGGHSSTPDKNNPLVRLSKFIVYTEKHKLFKPYLQDTTIETFSKLSLKMKGMLKFLFKHAKGIRHILAKIISKFSPVARSMVQTTLCFCKAKGSDGFNIIPEEAYVTGNIRVAHHDNKKDIISKLTKIASKFNIEVEVLDEGYSSPVCSIKNKEYKQFTKIINDNFSDVICVPYISTGASDSKYFSDLSKNNFRFAPFRVTNEQLDTMHAKDENVDVSCLEPAVNFYKDLIKRS